MPKTKTNTRVLMLIENNSYPQDVRVRSEAEALMAAGYDVSVISPARKGQPRHESVNGAHVYRFAEPLEARGFFGYVWEYGYNTLAILMISFLVLFRHGFDIIHAANPSDTLVLVALIYKPFGKRFIFDHHDLSPEMYQTNFGERSNPFVHRVLVWLEKLSCRTADHVIATNESYREMDMLRSGVPAHKITIVRNGPDPSKFHLVKPDSVLTASGKRVIAYVGSMGPHDGIDYLLRALRHLRFDLNRDDFICVLVGGKGGEFDLLKRMSSDLGLDGNVRFTGWVSEETKLSVLSAADICVDPDPCDPFNDRSTMIKVAEYMALGKPIVAFDLRENRFTAQEAAVYVGGNNEMEFARALARLMDDGEQCRRMGDYGLRRVREEIAWPYSVPNLLAAYRALDSPQPDRARTVATSPMPTETEERTHA